MARALTMALLLLVVESAFPALLARAGATLHFGGRHSLHKGH